MAGLARIVLWRRERPVIVEPLRQWHAADHAALRQDRAPAGRPLFDEIPAAEARRQDAGHRRGDDRSKKTSFEPQKFDDTYEAAA